MGEKPNPKVVSEMRKSEAKDLKVYGKIAEYGLPIAGMFINPFFCIFFE